MDIEKMFKTLLDNINDGNPIITNDGHELKMTYYGDFYDTIYFRIPRIKYWLFAFTWSDETTNFFSAHPFYLVDKWNESHTMYFTYDINNSIADIIKFIYEYQNYLYFTAFTYNFLNPSKMEPIREIIKDSDFKHLTTDIVYHYRSYYPLLKRKLQKFINGKFPNSFKVNQCHNFNIVFSGNKEDIEKYKSMINKDLYSEICKIVIDNDEDYKNNIKWLTRGGCDELMYRYADEIFVRFVQKEMLY